MINFNPCCCAKYMYMLLPSILFTMSDCLYLPLTQSCTDILPVKTYIMNSEVSEWSIFSKISKIFGAGGSAPWTPAGGYPGPPSRTHLHTVLATRLPCSIVCQYLRQEKRTCWFAETFRNSDANFVIMIRFAVHGNGLLCV